MFISDESDDGEKRRRVIRIDMPLPEFTGRRKRMVGILDNLIDILKSEEISNLPMPPPPKLIDELHNEVLMKMVTLESIFKFVNKQLPEESKENSNEDEPFR